MDAKLSNCASPILWDKKEEDTWGNLPSELQEHVLAFLPALKLLELQGVCRAWRQLFCSSRFKERWKSVRTSRGTNADSLNVWMMRSHDQGSIVVYIPILRKSAPFSSFVTALPSVSFIRAQSKYDDVQPAHVRLLGGTEQFMFLERKHRWGRRFLMVYDTITGQGKDLQHPYDTKSYSLSPLSVTMSTKDCSPDCFRIIINIYGMRRCSSRLSEKYPNASFVWGRSREFHELRVYDSETNCWVSFAQSSVMQADPSDINAVLHADFLDFDQRKSTLHAWHSKKWTKVCVIFAEETPILSATRSKKEGKCAYRWDVNTFKVVKCQEHIYLTSPMVEKERNVMVRGFIVWRLTAKGAELTSMSSPIQAFPSLSLSSSSSSLPPSCRWVWSEVSRTPLQLLTILRRDKCFHPSFLSDGSHICMSSSHEPVVYDVLNGSWYCLTKKMQALFTMNLHFPSTFGKPEAVRKNKRIECKDASDLHSIQTIDLMNALSANINV